MLSSLLSLSPTKLSSPPQPTSSFTTTRLNSTTFLITEHDSFNEEPFIYALLHPIAPLLILTDTGCDSPSERYTNARFTHLREYIENCPLPCNNDQSLNPSSSARQYILISTHCHYDHTLGIPQFLTDPGSSDVTVIASAAGRDFVTSNLALHGLFEYLSLPVPEYSVTHWAGAFERYVHNGTNTGITFLHTPGHTPDSLAWYDWGEKWLFVGDSLYEERVANDGGESGKGSVPGAAILFPPQGNVVEWVFSIRKLLAFVVGENKRLAGCKTRRVGEDEDWVVVDRRVRLACGHVTADGDAEELLDKALRLLDAVLKGDIPVIGERKHNREKYRAWRQDGWGMYFAAPVRLMNDARSFFGFDDRTSSQG